MVKYDEIRCYHFHPDGSTVGDGCPYGNSCNYAHPGDSFWETAKTSTHYSRSGPRGAYRQRKYSSGDRRRPRSRSRSRDNGWGRRRRRSSASGSPIQQRRRDSIASSVASERDNDPRDKTTLIKPSYRGPPESPHRSKAPVPTSPRPSLPPPPPEQTPPVLPPPPPSSSVTSKTRTERPSLLDRIKLEEEEESPRVTGPPVTAPEQSPKITAPLRVATPEEESPRTTTSYPVTAPAKFSKKNWHMNGPIEPTQIMLPTPPSSSADNMAFTSMPPPPPPSSADSMALTDMPPPPQPTAIAPFASETPIKIIPPKPPSPSKPSIGPPPVPPPARETNPLEDDEADPKHDHKFWLDKIEQIYLAVNARAELERKKDELSLQRQFLNTTGFSALDAIRQNRIKEKIERLDAEQQTAITTYDAAVHELTKLEIWPTDIVARERESLEDMKKTKEALQKLEALATEFEGLVKGGKPLEPVQQDDAMDVDAGEPAAGPSSKPAKRRRTESGSVPSEGSRDADIESLRERLHVLDGNYAELDNAVEESFRDRHEEWIGAVDAKIDERLAPLTSGLPTPKEIKHMKRDVEALEDLIKELAPGIGELADRNAERESRLAEAQRSLLESDTVIASLMQRLDVAEQEREVTRRRLAELETAYENQIANRPVATPELPSQEVLYHLLEEPLADLVRDEWRTIADPVRQDVQRMLLEGNADLRKSVWSSLSSTLKMVENLSQRLGVPPPNIQGSQ